MTTLTLHTRTITVPTSLNELSARQLIGITGIITTTPDPYRAGWLIILALLNIQQRFWLRWFFLLNYYIKPFLGRIGFNVVCYQLSDDNLDELLLVSDFLYNDPKPLTTNLLPTLHVRQHYYKRTKLYGFADEFTDLTFKDFRFAETRFLLYLKTKSTDHLNALIAVLYTTAPRNGSNQHLANKPLAERETLAARLPLPVKLSILQTYQGCRQHLSEQHKNVFPPKRTDPDKPPKELTYKDVLTQNKAWEETITQYATNPVQMDAIDTAPLWNVLKKLDYDIAQAKKQKAELKKHK